MEKSEPGVVVEAAEAKEPPEPVKDALEALASTGEPTEAGTPIKAPMVYENWLPSAPKKEEEEALETETRPAEEEGGKTGMEGGEEGLPIEPEGVKQKEEGEGKGTGEKPQAEGDQAEKAADAGPEKKKGKKSVVACIRIPVNGCYAHERH